MPLLESGITSLATAGRPPRATALAPKLLALSALLCAMAVSGCARHPEQPGAVSACVEPGSRTCSSNRALLAPLPSPDCEFRRADSKTMDPAEFAHLKLDYERQCYQRAEKAARDRLRRLQAEKRCEAKLRRSPADYG